MLTTFKDIHNFHPQQIQITAHQHAFCALFIPSGIEIAKLMRNFAC